MNSSTTNQPNGYTGDLSGNMTVEPLAPQNYMTYDGENRMTAFSGNGGAASYTYDGDGLRVVKSITGGTTTVSIYSGSSVLAEYDSGAAPASPSREYVYNGADDTTGLLAMFSGGATTYYHQDHLSVRLTTDGTSGSPTYGQVLNQEGHFPYGEQRYQSGAANKWLFTGYDRDPEGGLDYALALYYDTTPSGRVTRSTLLSLPIPLQHPQCGCRDCGSRRILWRGPCVGRSQGQGQRCEQPRYY